jgi:hypothetical protein
LIQWVEGGILYIHEQLWDMGQSMVMELPIMNHFIWKSNKPNLFLQKDKVVTILFQSYNFILISYEFFWSKIKCFTFQSWFYKYMFF